MIREPTVTEMGRLGTILLAAFCLLNGCSDTIESSHASMTAAKSEVDRGWIPAVLPASATEIREWHDLDTNTGEGTFSFAASDADQFRAALAVLPSGEATRSERIPRRQLERAGFSFYRHGGFCLAVDWNRQRGMFWLITPR